MTPSAEMPRKATTCLPAEDHAVLDPVRPFLKWAGGKRQLLPAIRPFYPVQFRKYWEPFLGSGAVFFDLWNRGRLQAGRVCLIDNNRDLIGCYRALRDQVDEVVERLKALARRHQKDAHKCFYQVRHRFNTLRLALLDEGEYGPELAAMLIYLNRTGFNGLYRLNARGSFNVPMGRYVNPQICDEPNLRAVGNVLLELDVELRHGLYHSVVEDAQAGDFVYFDPPYAPLSTTSSFRSYTAEGFTSADQKHLQSVVLQLIERRCTVVLSNSTAPEIERLYEHDTEARRAGVKVARVKARRAINSKASRRGSIDELLITSAPAPISSAAVAVLH